MNSSCLLVTKQQKTTISLVPRPLIQRVYRLQYNETNSILLLLSQIYVPT